MGNTQKVVIIADTSIIALCLLSCMLFFSFSSKSQTLNFDNISVDQGLSQNTLGPIVCDSFGLIWLGTADGLNCYDGHRMIQYHHRENDSFSLHNDYIYFIIVSKGQDLIIYGKKGVEFYDRKTDKFHMLIAVEEMEKRPISGLVVGSSYSKVWLVNYNKTLVEIDKYTRKLKSYDSYVCPLINDENLSIDFANNNETDFFFSNRTKLYHFNCVTHHLSVVDSSDKSAYYYVEKGGKNYYVIQQNVILYKNIKDGNTIRYSIRGGTIAPNFKFINQDKNGNFWIQFPKKKSALLYKEPSGDYTISNVNTNIGNVQQSTTVSDLVGNLWMGTDGSGVFFLNHNKLNIEKYTVPNTPLMVKAFCPIDADNILVGTVADGLYKFTISQKKFIKIASINHKEIYALCKKNNDEILIGTLYGIVSYNIKTQQTKTNLYPRSDSIYMSKQILIEGNLLYISSLGGLTVYDMTTGKEVDKHLTLNISSIHQISFEPNHKNFFILTEYVGIKYFNGIEYIEINPKVFKSCFFSVRHLYRYNDSIYWFATEQGLLKVIFENSAKTKHHSFLYTTDHGLPNNFIYSIIPAANNRLWLSTNKGICEFDPIHISCINYGINDGLQSNEFNTGAFQVLPNGSILYGGVQGINVMNPQKLLNTRRKPNIYIKEIRTPHTNYSLMNLPSELEMPYNDNLLQLNFFTDDLSDPTKNKYYYMLEGLDNNWVMVQGNNQLRYVGLEPGKYILRLKVINGDNISSDEKTLYITITPPIWQTWWFIIPMAIFVLFGIIYIVQRVSNMNIKRKLKELQRKQEIEGIRQRISSDLHDDIGSGLSKMALISELAKSQTQNPEELQNKLSRLTENSRDMIRSLGEIVWAINPQNDKLPNLLAYMRAYASEYLETTDIVITYHIQESQEATAINPDFKRNIFLILKESLHNAVKYAEATHIEIGFTVKNNNNTPIEYQFWISDNGKGIDQNAMRKFGHGLSSIKKRAESIGALYTLESSMGKGVKIMLEGTL